MAKAEKLSKKGDNWFRPLELYETDDLVKELMVRHPVSFMILSTQRPIIGENEPPFKTRVLGDPLLVFKAIRQATNWYLGELDEGNRMRINNYLTFGNAGREDDDEDDDD